MSYFNEIADYATYSGHEADFHFTYNANSGGGQAFFRGRFFVVWTVDYSLPSQQYVQRFSTGIPTDSSISSKRLYCSEVNFNSLRISSII